MLILGTFRIRAGYLLSQWEQCQAEEGACARDAGLREGAVLPVVACHVGWTLCCVQVLALCGECLRGSGEIPTSFSAVKGFNKHCNLYFFVWVLFCCGDLKSIAEMCVCVLGLDDDGDLKGNYLVLSLPHTF